MMKWMLFAAALATAAAPTGRAGAVASAPSAPPAADSTQTFAASATLTLAAAGEGLHRVPLPLAVLQRLRAPDWRDLRVVNAAGETVAMAWAGAAAAAPAPPAAGVELPRFAWPAPAEGAGGDELRVELRADGAVVSVHRRAAARPARSPAGDARSAQREWLLDLSSLTGARPQALELVWPARPGGSVHAVKVLASTDTRRWSAAGAGTVLELSDAASGHSVTQRRVELSALDPRTRYLRLQFDAPLALTRALAHPAPLAAAPVLDTARFKPQRSGSHEWTLDAGAVLPVARLQVHLAQDNSVWPLGLAWSPPAPRADAPPDWRVLPGHTAYRFLRDGVRVESLPQALGAVAARRWRFTLDPRLAAPEVGPEVSLHWTAPQLVFAATGQGPFRLVFGREGGSAAAIERQVLMPGYRDGDEFKLPAALAGPVVETAVPEISWVERLARAESADVRRWVLWGALAAAVAVLALLAWRLARDLRAG